MSQTSRLLNKNYACNKNAVESQDLCETLAWGLNYMSVVSNTMFI